MTAAQTEADVVAGYYKAVATPSATAGTYALTVEFADEVVPAVSFAVSNFKKGLYYGVATGDTPDSGVALGMPQCTDETAGVELKAETGARYYKVVVSDTETVESRAARVRRGDVPRAWRSAATRILL